MWFGVDDGVRVYDGVKWTALNKADGVLGRPVLTLCTTRDGSVYAGTYIGISRYRNGKWERVFSAKNDVPLYIQDLLEASDGSIGAATSVRSVKATEGDHNLLCAREPSSNGGDISA